MSAGDEGTMARTEFHGLLALAGIELPGETRPAERRRLLDELGLGWLFSELVATDPAQARARRPHPSSGDGPGWASSTRPRRSFAWGAPSPRTAAGEPLPRGTMTTRTDQQPPPRPMLAPRPRPRPCPRRHGARWPPSETTPTSPPPLRPVLDRANAAGSSGRASAGLPRADLGARAPREGAPAALPPGRRRPDLPSLDGVADPVARGTRDATKPPGQGCDSGV